MPRRAHLSVPGIAWHIIQRGDNRTPCFYADSDYRIYVLGCACMHIACFCWLHEQSYGVSLHLNGYNHWIVDAFKKESVIDPTLRHDELMSRERPLFSAPMSRFRRIGFQPLRFIFRSRTQSISLEM